MTAFAALNTAALLVGLYARVSRGKGSTSVDDQLSELRDWAESAGATVVREEQDKVSASRYAAGKDRDGWPAMRAAITAGEVNALAVWEGSRATRKLSEYADLADELRELGCLLIVGGRVYDLRNADDARALGMSAVDSEHESAQRSERVQRGKVKAAQRGGVTGRAPYGYRSAPNPADPAGRRRVWLIVPEHAAVIRDVVAALLAGTTAYAVAAKLNAAGVAAPMGGAWTGGTLLRTVARPALAGKRVHQGKVVPVTHRIDFTTGRVVPVADPADARPDWEPIVTLAEHNALVALLDDRAGREVRKTSRLVVGIATCGVCGGPVRTTTRRPRGGDPVTYYGCATNRCATRAAADVDAVVHAVARRVLADPRIMAAILAPADDSPARAAVEDAKRELAEIRRLARERRPDGSRRMSVVMAADLEADALARLERAESALRPAHVPAVVAETAGPDAAARWAALELEQQRAVLRVVARVEILPAGRGCRRVHPETLVRVTPAA